MSLFKDESYTGLQCVKLLVITPKNPENSNTLSGYVENHVK